jgi:hypothetical protein
MATRKAKTIPIVEDRVQTCESCRYRFAKHDYQECRRYPPKIVLDMQDGGHFSAFPLISLEEFCGEWAAKLNS